MAKVGLKANGKGRRKIGSKKRIAKRKVKRKGKKR